MKYFLVVGEASGDLHASNLMREILQRDPEARFAFFGGDQMASVGGKPIKHYREMAFMGITAVLMNAGKILANMSLCKKSILDWKPDVLILVDYASFNLRIAAFVQKEMPEVSVHFYISPKLWAWKSYRIKSFRAYIKHLYVILPFEKTYFDKLNYPVEYVGNPSVDSMKAYFERPFDEVAFKHKHGLDERPIIALLPGSRTGEIKRNLPIMREAVARFSGFQVLVAGAPGQDQSIYNQILDKSDHVVFGETYSLLRMSIAAMVTSGTATLETALIGIPQVVCFAVDGGSIPNWIFKTFMHVPYFSLVNLIVNKPLVKELLGNQCTVENLCAAFEPLLTDSDQRKAILEGYALMKRELGPSGASQRAAEAILSNVKR